MEHLNPDSLDSFAEQLSETPTTLPSFFEVVAMVGAATVDVFALQDVADVKRFWIALRAHNEWLDAHPEYGL